MSDEQYSESTQFILEEYRTIAATHDKLRDIIVRLFNYFILMAALPFTVAGVVFSGREFNFLCAPTSLHLLFLLEGIIFLFVGLFIVDVRLDQYRYAHAVNATRKYFLDKDKSLLPYLVLPTRADLPPFSRLGFVSYQVGVVIGCGAVYVVYGSYGVFAGLASCQSVLALLLSLLAGFVYILTYTKLRATRIRHRIMAQHAGTPTVGDNPPPADRAS